MNNTKEAIADANAHLNNVCLPSYTDLANALFIAQCSLGRTGANVNVAHKERATWEILRNLVEQVKPYLD